MKFIKIKTLLLSLSLISTSYTAEKFYEDGFIPSNVLADTIQKNREFFLNQKFTNGQTLINLMPYDGIDRVRIEKNASGHVRTHYVLDGWNLTFKQYGSCIAPNMESANSNLRPDRLDGQGYAKENRDGSISLGKFNMKNAQPIEGSAFSAVNLLSLPQELHIHNQEQQRQRRPEGLRDKEFSKRAPLVEHKPTPEDLQAIANTKKLSRQSQLEQLSSTFASLNLELLKDAQSLEQIKRLKIGIPLLQRFLENEGAFNSSFNNLKKDASDLQNNIREKLITTHSKSTYSSDDMPLPAMSTLTKEAKEEADRQILKETKREESRLNRPNANPSGKEEVVEAKENFELNTNTKNLPYVFRNPLDHKIIKALSQTSNEDSSYTGIKISREELENFVTFLRDSEANERTQTIETTINVIELRYYYAPDKGDGSHTKVKLGYGTKPIILSQQGLNLTTRQMQDVKAVLEQKGLL